MKTPITDAAYNSATDESGRVDALLACSEQLERELIITRKGLDYCLDQLFAKHRQTPGIATLIRNTQEIFLAEKK